MKKFFLKEKVNPQNESPNEESHSTIWCIYELYELKELDRNINSSTSLELNFSLMDAGQKLSFKALDSLDLYQSILKYQNIRNGISSSIK